LGAEIEDKLALQAFVGEKLTGERLTVVDNSLSPTTMKEVDERLAECLMSYTGRVMIHGTILEEAPLCLRRIFRLDNIARKSLVVRTGITADEYGRTSFNTKLSLEIVSMLARGAATSLTLSSSRPWPRRWYGENHPVAPRVQEHGTGRGTNVQDYQSTTERTPQRSYQYGHTRQHLGQT
jgi:hypothetical protein